MKKSLLLVVCGLLLASVAGAKVTLPSVLADNMVLQQQSSVKLWGEAEPGKKVTITSSWDQKTYSTQAGQDGKWLTKVDTPTAGGPYEVTISDGEALTLKNILIGEVWFCSGQSNMEMPVKGFGSSPIEGSNELIAKAKASTPIRIYTAKLTYSRSLKEDCEGQWRVNDSEGVATASATAYFFAQFLQEALDVPVGIVVSSWGGSKVEAWMSNEALNSFKGEVNMDHLAGSGEVQQPNQRGSLLYNGMINPYLNLTIRGMIWYQGESNAGNPELYRRLMPAFVASTREDFGQGEFPFYYVQIAPHRYGGADQVGSARLREAQMLNMKDIPNSGMAITLDIAGPAYNIHPAQKKEVGDRLAYWALAKTYGKKDFSYCGPIYKSMEVKDGKAILSFEYADMRLAPFSEELKGFEIAGADQVFYPAVATVQGDHLVVASESVASPAAVRYCFKNFATGNLTNTYSLPASSFRTDNWDINN